ncbi:tRNA adenosine(34) deaminase TadA [Oxynema aestuarii]|jgi:tRNA(adenine34) deaminase|uniref:tRNA-specific adenosine deaminase n=1 Tax=Oxynema aestuarii AP17 TaxID=2064643 RepID=A0A6H1U2K0_9CYAN|nr:tRNA adenosine(34) deaminase TadA [Oxynema aestuarii]QIZ73051.1 nucleoside deaminase [Oxynema aestuarii AP17]RMH71486.1 MAG: nucleoside deaminase [Cyanobacteria bacterium J007]
MICDRPYSFHRQWMQQALTLAERAGEAGEIPVGALIINKKGEAIARGENRRERDCDPTAHAEIVALREAGKVLQNWHLNDCTLYVTLEPCPMCAAAIAQSRLKLLVYGADDPKAGAIRTAANLPDSACCFHRLEVLAGIAERDCREQLQSWFGRRRARKTGKRSAPVEQLSDP